MTSDISDLTADERDELLRFAKGHLNQINGKKLLVAIKKSLVKREAQRKRRRRHLRQVAFPNAYKLFVIALGDRRVEDKLRSDAKVRLRLTIHTPLATIVARLTLASDRRHAAFYSNALNEAALQKVDPATIDETLDQRTLSITRLSKAFRARRKEASSTERSALPRLSWSDGARDKFEKRKDEVKRLVLLVELDAGKAVVRRATASGDKAWSYLSQRRE